MRRERTVTPLEWEVRGKTIENTWAQPSRWHRTLTETLTETHLYWWAKVLFRMNYKPVSFWGLPDKGRVSLQRKGFTVYPFVALMQRVFYPSVYFHSCHQTNRDFSEQSKAGLRIRGALREPEMACGRWCYQPGWSIKGLITLMFFAEVISCEEGVEGTGRGEEGDCWPAGDLAAIHDVRLCDCNSCSKPFVPLPPHLSFIFISALLHRNRRPASNLHLHRTSPMSSRLDRCPRTLFAGEKHKKTTHMHIETTPECYVAIWRQQLDSRNTPTQTIWSWAESSFMWITAYVAKMKTLHWERKQFCVTDALMWLYVILCCMHSS